MARHRSTAPTKAPNGTWGFVVDLGPGRDSNGEWRERRQARRRGFPTRKAAQEALDELKVDSRAGTYVAPRVQTLQEFLETEWLPATKRRVGESTYESYERNIRNHIVPNLGCIRLQELTPGQLDDFYSHLQANGRIRGQQGPGLKPRTVRYIATILGRALKDAVKLRQIQVNPAEAATPPSPKASKAPEMKTWTAPQLATFLERTADDRYGKPWMFLALTGCRRGEALGLRWTDLDLDEKVATIRQQVIPLPKAKGHGREPGIVPDTKGGEARVIELDDRTVAMLRAWRAEQNQERLLLGAGYHDQDLVFPRPDGDPFHPEKFSRQFDRWLAKTTFQDLPTIRLHDYADVRVMPTWSRVACSAAVPGRIMSA